jgi:hypothetical protein
VNEHVNVAVVIVNVVHAYPDKLGNAQPAGQAEM